MASFITHSDVSNTAVREFLTKVGTLYNEGVKFNTSSANGKKIWEKIKAEFDYSCCYCGKKTDKLTIEHLISINRIEYGLHHPGNVVPACKKCNKSRKDWKGHLKKIAGDKFNDRLKKIKRHIKKYKYPSLKGEEKKTIKVIADSLYKNITLEGEKAYKLYESLREEFL